MGGEFGPLTLNTEVSICLQIVRSKAGERKERTYAHVTKKLPEPSRETKLEERLSLRFSNNQNFLNTVVGGELQI